MFVILVEHILAKGEAIGPFEHQEDAEDYRAKHFKVNVCRVVKLIPPEKSE